MYAENQQAVAALVRRDIDDVQTLTASPIEDAMGLSFLAKRLGIIPCSTADLAGRHRDTVGVFLTPQHPVGPYFADFVITARVAATDAVPRPGTRRNLLVTQIAVECDGHEFHERTKEQARHDRARDRFFFANGIPVLRFTGSEIAASPLRCAAEVEGILAAAIGKLEASS